MGRHRTPLQRALDPKPYASRLFQWLTTGRPRLGRALGFYPYIGPPDPSRLTVLHESVHKFPLQFEPYMAALNEVSKHSVERLSTNTAWKDEWSAQRVVALVEDVAVPGHTLVPVDWQAQRQVHLDASGPLSWGIAHPGLVALGERDVEGVSIVIPIVKHYGHLLTDVMFPYLFALGTLGVCKGETINVVTAKDFIRKKGYLLLVRGFIKALGHLGYDVRHIELSLFETARLDRLLYAAAHTTNGERRFAFPETIAPALAAFRKGYGVDSQKSYPSLLYLKRGDMRTRQIAGEQQLIEILGQNGFHIFEARWGNHADQVEYFSHADVIAGVHGGGLANALWAKKGAVLIELMALNARKSTGLHWASEAGIAYEYVFGSNEERLQNFSVDAEAAARTIIAIAERYSKGSTRPTVTTAAS